MEHYPHVHNYRPLPPRSHLWRRMAKSAVIVLGIITVGLGIGISGYRGLEGLSWVDSFLNAAMILSGMGPANELHTMAGKVFAGCYAIFSGVLFITMAAVLFAPVVHRFMHRFHLELERRDEA